jgi:hypothetical protein
MTPRTQKVTSSLNDGWNFGGNRVRIDACRMWLYVYDRCHAPASPRRPNVSIARATCCCMSINSPIGPTTGPGMLHFAASSLSLPRASSAAETAGPAKRSQTGVHRQASTQPGSARAGVRCGQRIVHQRGGQPSVARAAAARARAWVSRNQFGDAPCNWNIDSTVGCQTSSHTCTSCSCRTDVSKSDAILRNQRTQRQE